MNGAFSMKGEIPNACPLSKSLVFEVSFLAEPQRRRRDAEKIICALRAA
jgi:hypothetical protein